MTNFPFPPDCSREQSGLSDAESVPSVHALGRGGTMIAEKKRRSQSSVASIAEWTLRRLKRIYNVRRLIEITHAEIHTFTLSPMLVHPRRD